MAGRSSKPFVASKQGSVECFGQCHVHGVISRKIVPQMPYAQQKEIVRMSVQGKVSEVGESHAAAFRIDLAVRSIPPNDLSNFDVEQMGCVQCL